MTVYVLLHAGLGQSRRGCTNGRQKKDCIAIIGKLRIFCQFRHRGEAVRRIEKRRTAEEGTAGSSYEGLKRKVF